MQKGSATWKIFKQPGGLGIIPVIGHKAVSHRAILELILPHLHVPASAPVAGGEEEDLLGSS